MSDELVPVLEGIAHYAPGRAGVVARDALVEAGVWSATVERDERPTALEGWLDRAAYMPGHDIPMAGCVAQALVAGTIELVVR